MRDPLITDRDPYEMISENERIRVRDYRDAPGTNDGAALAPGQGLYVLSSFRHRPTTGGRDADVQLGAGQERWTPLSRTRAATPADTNTHVIFMELKGTPASACAPGIAGAPAARAQSSV